MAITTTTLSAAIDAVATQFAVAATTGITAGNSATGSGITVLYCDSEYMYVVGVGSLTTGPVSVLRGQGGTQATAHGASAPVLIGLPSDFSGFTPAQGVVVQRNDNYAAISAPVTAATTITASGAIFHIVGTTAAATITRPTGMIEGRITVIADGVWTWTTAGNIAVAGTVTTAGSAVSFVYDVATSKWYPSRLA